jgi:branched-chain amino acid transport system permease protein
MVRLNTKKSLPGWSGILILAAIVLCFPFIVPYAVLPAEIVIFGLFALAFDILFGHTGLVSFGHAAFFGAGAYTAVLMSIHLPTNILLNLLGGTVAAMALAGIIGGLAIQLRGLYLAMVTLASAQLLYFIANQMTDLTGGDNGLSGVRVPLTLGPLRLPFDSPLAYYFLVATCFFTSFLLLRRLANSPFGSVLHAIRENEERARTVGYNVQWFKLLAFVLSGAFAGMAGALYGMLLKFAYLDLLYWTTSGQVVMMTLVGGAGTLYGPLLGAALMITISDIVAKYWLNWPIILGAIFVACVLFARGGMWEGLRKLWEWMGPAKH